MSQLCGFGLIETLVKRFNVLGVSGFAVAILAVELCSSLSSLTVKSEVQC
jgi:hypothetical protein